jgi:nicotinamidase-related amidase
LKFDLTELVASAAIAIKMKGASSALPAAGQAPSIMKKESLNPDLHGSAPDKSPVALLLIDVINDLEFPEGEQILPAALEMAKRIAALKRRAQQIGIPCIYANDNFGRWQSDFGKQVDHCLRDEVRGKPLVELLLPTDKDYSIVKPKHSGFYSTPLELLLNYLGAQTLILTGIAGNICVLYTANDAYMRDYRIFAPADCSCSNSAEENSYALKQMERFLKADIRDSTELDLEAMHAQKP